MKLRWRKLIPRAIVLLLLGAIVNVAVAWGFSWAVQASVIRAKSVVDRYYSSKYSVQSSIGRPDEAELHLNVLAGFPIRSLEGSYSWDRTSSDPNSPSYYVGDPPIPIIIPCRPLWPGFAINTLLYVAILWGLFAAPGMIRRRVRIRRGRCPACGYIIAPGTASGGGVCSECGAAVPRRAESAT